MSKPNRSKLSFLYDYQNVIPKYKTDIKIPSLIKRMFRSSKCTGVSSRKYDTFHPNFIIFPILPRTTTADLINQIRFR